MTADRPGDRAGDAGSDDELAPDWTVLEVPVDAPPGPIAPDEIPDPGDDAPSGPPGGRIFTLEGRPAPGLYFIAWLLALGGLAVLFVAVLAQSPGVTPILGLVAFATLGLGLAAGAGYQVVARRDRHPSGYRGPSPVLVFGVALALSSVVAGIGFALGLGRPDAPVPFLIGLGIVAIAYVAAVWLFVVRTGALGWREMGWPAARSGALGRAAVDALFAVGVMVPTTFIVLIAGGLIATLLGVEAPQVLPRAATSVDAIAVAVAAAIVAPVGEELFFRGFALTAWARDLGPQRALVRSALFFAVVHIANVSATSFAAGAAQAFLQFVVILPLGLILGWIFMQRGIVASIAGHVAYNGILLALLAVATSVAPP